MTARAVLFMKQANGRVSNDEFTDADYPSPYHAAQDMKAATGDDFSDAIWAIGQNDESKKLMAAENMRRMNIWTEDEIQESLA